MNERSIDDHLQKNYNNYSVKNNNININIIENINIVKSSALWDNYFWIYICNMHLFYCTCTFLCRLLTFCLWNTYFLTKNYVKQSKNIIPLSLLMYSTPNRCALNEYLFCFVEKCFFVLSRRHVFDSGSATNIFISSFIM